MARTAGGAILAVIAALACSACGSGYMLNGVGRGSIQAVTVVAPLAQQLPLSRIGTGSASLGTFAVHGNLHLRATCVGTGTIKVTLTSRHEGLGIGPVRCRGENTLALDSGSNYGTNHPGPVEITVQAPAHTRWWLDVVDRQPNF